MTELVVGALLSGVFNVLVDRLASREVLNFLGGQKNDEGRRTLDKLKLKLRVLQVVLNDAESKQFTKPAVKRWLDGLKHVVYQAEDLLDLIDYQVLLYQKDRNGQVRDPTSTPAISFDPKIGSKLEEITDMLDDFVKERDVLGLGEVDRSRSIPSTSLVDESSVYGRENDKEEIIKLLLSDEASDTAISVIPIVGMGGVGKTTLAQLVYNDSRVDGHFKKKAWACVSDKFDIARITKSILQELGGRASSASTLNQLQVALKNTLKGKKCLIVLDDIWNDDYSDWDSLITPLKSGAHGSKIIVTTRNQSVVDTTGTTPVHKLQQLSDEHCWSLFSKIAIRNGDFSNFPKLEEIGRKIVEKCKGLPLAAKTLGGLLRSKLDVGEWNNILESEIWNLTKNQNKILPALGLSYVYLSSQSKQCFAYCSVFPKDYRFRRQTMVQIWIAQNFVQQQGNEKIETSADEIFQELVSRSFFQQSSESESHFVMHDLVHDLAQYVAGQFSLCLEGKKLHDISEHVRHVSCNIDAGDEVDILKASNKVRCLRTLIIFDYDELDADFPSQKTWADMFPTMNCLRVLVFPFSDRSELHKWIGGMIHLCYLDLSHSSFVELPEAVCNLHNLQTLSLKECWNLVKLPANIGKLNCLRHLYNSGFSLEEMPKEITRLSGLLHLSHFAVGDQSKLGINGLQAFDHLEGKLLISNLHNVMSKEDALAAKLKEKKLLRALKLKWGYFKEHDDSQHEKGVLENLKPHKNLEKLVIENYGGTTFPDWLGDHSFSNIIRLTLRDCCHCFSLPPLGQLPSLRELTIKNMRSIEEVGPEFYGSGNSVNSLVKRPFQSLKKLCFLSMRHWKKWSPPISGAEELFSQLEILQIEECPELIGSLPAYIPSLVKLEIRCCPKLSSFPVLGISPKLRRVVLDELESIETLCEEDHGMGISGCSKMVVEAPNLTNLKICHCSKLRLLPERLLPSLSRLTISGCPEIEYFPEGWLPSNLRSFTIIRCTKLKALPKQMPAFQSLQHLWIDGSSEIQSFQLLPFTLKSLFIANLPNLKSLGSLHLLVSLQDLMIVDCGKLESLPEDGLPPSLDRLCIRGCPLLAARYNGDERERRKIAHIPCIKIYAY